MSEPRNGYKTSSYGDLWHYAAESKIGGEDVTEELADEECQSLEICDGNKSKKRKNSFIGVH